MSYIIGTGYIRGWTPAAEDFAYWWKANTLRFADPPASRIVVVSVDGSGTPAAFKDSAIDVLNLNGNCGHIHHLLTGQKKHWIGGWSASVLALAMIAYNDESDLIYKEQDCLAFGPWVERMYADMGDADMVFGRKHETHPHMPCSQSLFLIRHRFLLDFVTRYLAKGTDNDKDNLPESKFEHIEKDDPSRFRRLSFGFDRERPIIYEEPVWYAQQLKPEEITEMVKRELL